jgi:hypothetical protein
MLQEKLFTKHCYAVSSFTTTLILSPFAVITCAGENISAPTNVPVSPDPVVIA